MGTLNPPVSIAQFKAQFGPRDFIYTSGIEGIMDSDISNGLNLASSVYNPELFSTVPIGIAPNITSEAVLAYCYAAAHFVVSSVQSVGGLGKKGRGVRSQGEGMTGNKSAGGLSLSMEWPSSIKDSPMLFQMTRTTYGMQYLQILAPLLVGNVSAVWGERGPGGSIPNPGFF